MKFIKIIFFLFLPIMIFSQKREIVTTTLDIFFEKIVPNETSLRDNYEALEIKRKFEKKYDVNIYYISENNLKSDYFIKKGIKIHSQNNSCELCEKIMEINSSKESSYIFEMTKVSCLGKKAFLGQKDEINKYLIESSNILFYWPTQHNNVEFNDVPVEVNNSPILKLGIISKSTYNVIAKFWIEHFENQKWLKSEKEPIILKPGLNLWTKEILTDSSMVAIEYKFDIDSTCNEIKHTNVIRYKYVNNVKPVNIKEKDNNSKTYYLLLDPDEIHCGAEKLINLDATTDSYQFIVDKQKGITMYKALFKDLCNPTEEEKELELLVDKSYNSENFIRLYLPQSTVINKNLLYRQEQTENGLNEYAKELNMTIKLVVDIRNSILINEEFESSKVVFQVCGNN